MARTSKSFRLNPIRQKKPRRTRRNTEDVLARHLCVTLCNSVLSVVKMGTLRPRTLALMGLANERAVFPGYGTAARLLG